jgi:hypothetical protein
VVKRAAGLTEQGLWNDLVKAAADVLLPLLLAEAGEGILGGAAEEGLVANDVGDGDGVTVS